MNKKRGFTLFELLVSISIVGILTAMAIVSFSSAQKKARDARRMQDIEAVGKAAEQYYTLSNANYPTSCTPGGAWAVNSQIVLESFPIDPKSGNYSVQTCETTGFCICATLEGQRGNSSDTSCTFAGVGGTGTYFCAKNQQ